MDLKHSSRRYGEAFVAFIGVLLWLTTVPAAAGDNGWVHEADQRVIDSRSAIEHPTGPDNLCEGTGASDSAILTGQDPHWVRVSGNADPTAPESRFTIAEGQVLPDSARAGAIPPGQLPWPNKIPPVIASPTFRTNPFLTWEDSFFDHTSYDVNVFLTLDPEYRRLLASGNFGTGEANEQGELELEWENAGIPYYALPVAGDRVKAWGNHVFDCGHDEHGVRTEMHPPVGWVVYRNTASRYDLHDNVPETKRTESPWRWYEQDDRQGTGATFPDSGLLDTPVQATTADVFFSSWGGQVMKSLNGGNDNGDGGRHNATTRLFLGRTWTQPVLSQDYTFFVPAPPKPTPDAALLYRSQDRCSTVPINPNQPRNSLENEILNGTGEIYPLSDIGSPICNIPDVASVSRDPAHPGITVTVKALSAGINYPSNAYIAYAKTWNVGWDYVPPIQDRVRTYSVDVEHMRVYDDAAPRCWDARWLMQLRINEQWVYPVRGFGESSHAFYDRNAIDDGKSCITGRGGYKEYPISVKKTVLILPGQDLRVTDRAYNVTSLTSTVLDEKLSPTRETPPVDLVRTMPQSLGDSKEHLFEAGLANGSYMGAHTLGIDVRDVTEVANRGTLLDAVGHGSEPLVITTGDLTYSPGDVPGQVEYRYWREGTTAPSHWTIITPPLRPGVYKATLPLPAKAVDNGNYAVEIASVHRLKDGQRVVSTRDRYQIKLQNPGEGGGAHGAHFPWVIIGSITGVTVAIGLAVLMLWKRRSPVRPR